MTQISMNDWLIEKTEAQVEAVIGLRRMTKVSEMANYARDHKRKSSQLRAELASLQSPEVDAPLKKLRDRYGKYAVSADELKKMLDDALGERTLTEMVYEIRDR